jgi:hypothetical protein
MSVALSVLCIGAVTFFLVTLVAILKELKRARSSTTKLFRVPFRSKRQAELIVMNAGNPQGQHSLEEGKRIAS